MAIPPATLTTLAVPAAITEEAMTSGAGIGISPKKGILNVETGLGINEESVDARFHINSSTEPYFIAGVDNGLNNANKVDLSDNTFIVGDANTNLLPKSTCFGDNNNNIGELGPQVGANR